MQNAFDSLNADILSAQQAALRGTDPAKQNLLNLPTLPDDNALQRAISIRTANNKELRKFRVAMRVQQFQRSEGDTGSTEVQGNTISQAL